MALTSSTADTPLDICSRALILIGADPISSFDDGTTEATVAVNMYEDDEYNPPGWSGDW